MTSSPCVPLYLGQVTEENSAYFFFSSTLAEHVLCAVNWALDFAKIQPGETNLNIDGVILKWSHSFKVLHKKYRTQKYSEVNFFKSIPRNVF